MGISMITALEIFTNPNDLEIAVGQVKVGGKFAFSIFRGPRHYYKPMISSQSFAETREDAIKVVEELLQMVYGVATREFENPESIVSQFTNPEGQEIDQSKTLNHALIGRILEELRLYGSASTCEMFASAG